MAKSAKKTTVAAASGHAGGTDPSTLLSGDAIQEAMDAAAADCFKRGIHDPEKVKEAKLKARERVKKDHAEAVRKAARAAKQG